MKAVFIIAVFIGYVNCGTTEPKDFSPQAVIHQLFELFRTLLKTGSNEHDLPMYDPLEFNHKGFHLDYDFLKATCNLTNIVFKGLTNFQLQEVNFSKNDISIEINIDWPIFTLNAAHYNLTGNIYESIPLLGQGSVDVQVHNISFWGTIYLKQSPNDKAILVDRMEKATFSIDKVVSLTEFDHNIDEIISAMVEELLAEYLTRFNKFLFASYRGMITDLMNTVLDKFDTWDILYSIL